MIRVRFVFMEFSYNYTCHSRSLQMDKKQKYPAFFSLLILMGSLFLWAEYVQAAFDYRYDSREEVKGQYEAASTAKLTRGITNVLFGWTEIGRTPAEMSAGIEHGALTSFLVGVPHGIFRAVGRTGVGVYETVTCFAPQSPIMKDLQGDVV